jgi:hypothetical protein
MKKIIFICFLIFGLTGFIALGQNEKPSGRLRILPMQGRRSLQK